MQVTNVPLTPLPAATTSPFKPSISGCYQIKNASVKPLPNTRVFDFMSNPYQNNHWHNRAPVMPMVVVFPSVLFGKRINNFLLQKMSKKLALLDKV